MAQTENEKRRYAALECALRCNSGNDYNDSALPVTNIDRIVEAASKFEKYLKGTK